MNSVMRSGADRTAVRLTADEALRTRRSVRAFLPTPVARREVEELLQLASRSPSGSNIQPWKVHVFSGAKRRQITRTILEAIDRGPREQYQREWNYYPQQWREPYIGRRRKIGWDMYGLLGIPKGDFEATERQRRQNYEFFGAPVGMMFTLEEDLEIGSWLDLGIFIGALATAARGRGLDTCPQVAFMQFHRIVTAHVGAPADEQVVCGMSLGWADPDAIENTLVTEREPVAAFVRFLA